MADFEFIKNNILGKWVILAPRRAKRTNIGTKPTGICPFCLGKEADEEELYRVGGKVKDDQWQIRVVPNKFPFTEHHEIIIHSPDHHKNIDELAFEQVQLIFQTYKQRFNANKQYGQVYIFHNRGHAGGESLPHPHSQLTVIPPELCSEIPKLESKKMFGLFAQSKKTEEVLETDEFAVFCPQTSEWPDEVWVAPKTQHGTFGEASDEQLKDLGFTVQRLIQIFDLRHGAEFPFNFYIAPDKNWYLRLIPRLKILGGFELGTYVMVNTQDPQETFAFIKEHFWEPNTEKIKAEHQAEYLRSV